MNKLPRVLCCDDDAEVHHVLHTLLKRHVNLESAFSVSEAKSMVEQKRFDAVLVDLHFEGQEEDGIHLIDFMNRKHPGVYLIVVSGDTSTRRVVEATRRRHFEFVPKGKRCTADLVDALARAFHSNAIPTDGLFQTEASAVKNILSQIERVVQSGTTGPCLILGETGTGKEVLARHLAKRLGLPIQAENMAAVPHDMAESVLFGHEKGAFTGAISRKVGAIEAAHGGIFFLDEVGECSPEVQAKLLRVIETKEVVPLGATKGKKIDVRFIAATHADLEARCKSGAFRLDLFQRLNTFVFRLPALRNRPEDVVLYSKAFLSGMKQSSPGFVFDDSGIAALLAHSWPGNTRELKNVIERIVVFSDRRRIDRTVVHDAIHHGKDEILRFSGGSHAAVDQAAVDVMTDSQKRLALASVLKNFKGNRRAAARAMKKSESTIYRWISELGIEEAVQSTRSSLS
jgi:DNA-binding NtrC family response regulator